MIPGGIKTDRYLSIVRGMKPPERCQKPKGQTGKACPWEELHYNLRWPYAAKWGLLGGAAANEA